MTGTTESTLFWAPPGLISSPSLASSASFSSRISKTATRAPRPPNLTSTTIQSGPRSRPPHRIVRIDGRRRRPREIEQVVAGTTRRRQGTQTKIPCDQAQVGAPMTDSDRSKLVRGNPWALLEGTDMVPASEALEHAPSAASLTELRERLFAAGNMLKLNPESPVSTPNFRWRCRFVGGPSYINGRSVQPLAACQSDDTISASALAICAPTSA